MTGKTSKKTKVTFHFSNKETQEFIKEEAVDISQIILNLQDKYTKHAKKKKLIRVVLEDKTVLYNPDYIMFIEIAEI